MSGPDLSSTCDIHCDTMKDLSAHLELVTCPEGATDG